MTTKAKRKHTPHQPTGRWIRVEKRLAIYLRDGFRCLWCDRDLHGAHPAEVTLDHAMPRSKGGSNSHRNLFTACRSCNSARADKPLRTTANAYHVQRIARHRRRKLDRYLRLARKLLAECAE